MTRLHFMAGATVTEAEEDGHPVGALLVLAARVALDVPAVASDAEPVGLDALADGECCCRLGVPVDGQHVRPDHGLGGDGHGT